MNVKIGGKKEPYLRVKRMVVEYTHNPDYPEDEVCICGHTYYRHFDTYDEMSPVGCKYCRCDNFKEL